MSTVNLEQGAAVMYSERINVTSELTSDYD